MGGGVTMLVEVYLEFPQNMVGIVRLRSVISYDKQGFKIKNYQELIDNTEFFCEDNDYRSEIIAYISTKIGVSQDNIKIMN